MKSKTSLPLIFSRPWFGSLWWALPQLLLLLLNFSDYSLIADEVSEENQFYWTVVFGIQGGFLLLVPFVFLALRTAGDGPKKILGIAFILFPAAAIVFGTLEVETAIPSSVDRWILSEGNIVFNLWAFQVFTSLFGLLTLSDRYAGSGGLKGLLAAGLFTVLPVIGLWLFFQLLHDTAVGARFTLSFIVVMVALATLALAFGVFRLCFELMGRIYGSRSSRGQSVGLSLLVALFLPIGGLCLNRAIPFPQDYQAGWVYALTVVNAVLLMIPASGNPSHRRLHLFGVAALLPFSLYFFCAFLPFYPLSALAMIAVGSGFLILAPVFLLLIHLGKLGNLLKGLRGPYRNGVTLVLGMALLPGVLLLEMTRDRIEIERALDYWAAPNPEQLDSPPSPRRVRRVVESVIRESRGIQYPILSPVYRTLVLDGMTMPDSTIRGLEGLFGFEAGDGAVDSLSFWSLRERGPSRNRGVSILPALAEAREIRFQARGADEVLVEMEIVNDSNERRTEFRQDFKLPPGVWISGAELRIEGEWKPAAFRERRSAEWIYRMIASERIRDPLLVTLRRPGEVTVEVFPVDADTPRQCRIRLQGLEPAFKGLRWGDAVWKNDDAEVSNWILSRDNVFVPANHGLPSVELEPEFHLILDRSAGSQSEEVFRESLQGTLRSLPDRARLKWWLFRDGVRELSSFPPRNNPGILGNADMESVLARGGGGFSREHGVLAVLNQWREGLEAGDIPEGYPVPMTVGRTVVEDPPAKILKFIDPRLGALSVWFETEGTGTTVPGGQKVSVIRTGRGLGLIPSQPGEGIGHWVFLYPRGHGGIEFFDPDEDRFEPVSSLGIVPVEDGSSSLTTVVGEALSRFDPARHEAERKEWIQRSKTESVLLPDTALIVLETSAQEEFLKRLEQTGTKGHSGLSFSETPEPILLLAGGVVLWILLRMRRREEMV